MVHERLQAHIIRENCLRRLRNATVSTGRGVRGRWVELGEQETGLGAVGVADDEAGEREAVLNEFLSA